MHKTEKAVSSEYFGQSFAFVSLSSLKTSRKISRYYKLKGISKSSWQAEGKLLLRILWFLNCLTLLTVIST